MYEHVYERRLIESFKDIVPERPHRVVTKSTGNSIFCERGLVQVRLIQIRVLIDFLNMINRRIPTFKTVDIDKRFWIEDLFDVGVA